MELFSGVTVSAGSSGSATTDSTATYTITDLIPGTYSVVSPAGDLSVLVTDMTTVVAAAVPQLGDAPPQSTAPSIAVTFVPTIHNVGNMDGTFGLTVEGLPADWTSAHSRRSPWLRAPAHPSPAP